MSAGARALRGFMAKEVRHILRDRQTLAILLLLPLVQVVLFGFALRTDVRDIRLVVIDPAPDDATTDLRARFAGNGRFRIVEVASRIAAVEPLFRRGDADLALVLEPGLASRIAAGLPARLQLVADASDPNTGSTMQAYAGAVIARWQAELAGDPRALRSPAGARVAPGAGSGSAGSVGSAGSAGSVWGAGSAGSVWGAGSAMRIEPSTRMRFNPTLESVNLFVPGLIALVLTLVSALMTAISLSREKERGTLEVLLVSPLRPWQIIVGKVLPYLALAFANVLTALAAAWLIFRVPFRGSLVLLLATSVLYSLVALALGVLIAARTSSQQSAMLGALVGTMLPNALLSGMIFPLASMPDWLRPVSTIVPARWFIEIARGVMLRGVGLAHLWQETLVLAAMLAVLLVAAMRSFHARLA